MNGTDWDKRDFDISYGAMMGQAFNLAQSEWLKDEKKDIEKLFRKYFALLLKARKNPLNLEAFKSNKEEISAWYYGRQQRSEENK